MSSKKKKTFKYQFVSSGGVKERVERGAGEAHEGEAHEAHDPCARGSCNEHAEAVKLLSSYSKGVRECLKDRFIDVNDLTLFDVLHPLRVP
jgi:hypothetical protein